MIESRNKNKLFYRHELIYKLQIIIKKIILYFIEMIQGNCTNQYETDD